MKTTTVGIDLAKNLFQVHGVNEHGKVVAVSNPNCNIGVH
mgnify:CR=1 FL=1|jgi:hypothetical protein